MISEAVAKAGSRREESDDYADIVAVLSPDWRVIECRGGIQWILQRRLGSRVGVGARWRSETYLRHRKTLIGAATGLCVHAGALAALEALPEIIGMAK